MQLVTKLLKAALFPPQSDLDQVCEHDVGSPWLHGQGFGRQPLALIDGPLAGQPGVRQRLGGVPDGGDLGEVAC
jgi:hypothetical protein